MALIPVLEREEKIQVGDKTRLSAVKSFITKDEVQPLSSILIKPEDSGTAIEVFDAADEKTWFLDWVYGDFVSDVAAGDYDKIYFSENGTDKTATVAPGSYSASTLVAAIQTALNAVATGVFTLTLDSKNRIAFASTVAFILKPGFGPSSLLEHIGVLKFTKSSTSFTSDPIEYAMKRVTVTLNNDLSTPDLPNPPIITPGITVTKYYYIQILTEALDALWSKDSDLVTKEPDILSWVPDGRATFINLHREAQAQILEFLDRQGYSDTLGAPITKFSIATPSVMRYWSMYCVLKNFFNGQYNAKDDVFEKKAKAYEALEIVARNKAILELDLDADGEPEGAVVLTTSSADLLRR